jgi:transcription initiation factor TFIID subunit 12
MATNEATATTAAPPNPANIITALTSAFKSQNGEAASSTRIAQLLEQNMGQLGELMRQGKLTAVQIQQVRRLLNQVRFIYLTRASYL